MLICTLVNFAHALATRRAVRRFHRALDAPREAQERLLMRLLARHAGSQFGRAHRFAAIDSPRTFARHVPLTDYDALAPWIDRIREGRPRVLTCDPVRRLTPTSGSTKATKLIPYTDALLHQFNAAIAPWLADLRRRHPALRHGPAYWSISPGIEPLPRVESAVPIGFDSDSAYLGAWFAPLIEKTFAVPHGLGLIRDVDHWRRQTLRHLLACRELRLISIWHPSFLTLLLDAMQRDWDDLLALLPSPRARQLARCGPRHIAGIWPRLRVVSCWTDAHAAAPAAELRRRLPHPIAIEPKGLVATEGIVSLPLAGRRPMAVTSHYFELLDDAGRAHPIHEAEKGGAYEVVITTAGGLYRYRPGDRVRVTGMCGRVPSITFLGRGDRVCDLVGEKLTDAFAADVIRALCNDERLAPGFAMLAPDHEACPPCYTLYIQADGALPSTLRGRLDTQLCNSFHYAHARRLGQLSPPRVFRITHAANAAYLDFHRQTGKRLGDIKPAALDTHTGWTQRFEGQYAPVADDARIARPLAGAV